MQRELTSDAFPIGSKLPVFSLLSCDGTTVTDHYLRDSLGLVVFTCNHCPYVKGSEAELVTTIKEFLPKGLKAVAISSNDAATYPEDSFEKMKDKAKALSLPYPYLYDESQTVAKSFDAACTPECYLFDAGGSLIFHGTINDNPRDPAAAKKTFLAQAIRQALEGRKPDPSFVHPIGCSIKWKVGASR